MGDEDIIPRDWHKVTSGKTRPGDKYWSSLCADNDPEKECKCGGEVGKLSCMFPSPYLVWLPITPGSEFSRRAIEDFPAVIRRNNE